MKLYMFRTVPLSIISSFSLYTQQCCMSYRFADSLRAGSGRSILILIARCQQTCITYTIAVCTVKNSWWWTEEMSETCRVSFQNKFEKLVHLVAFIIRMSLRYLRTCMQILKRTSEHSSPSSQFHSPCLCYVLAKSPGTQWMRSRVSVAQGIEPKFCSSELPKTLHILISQVYHIFTQHSAVRHVAHVRCCCKLSVSL